ADIGPQRNDVVEFADLGGEIGDERSEMLLLNGQAVLTVQLDELGKLAGLHAVVTLLVNHGRSQVFWLKEASVQPNTVRASISATLVGRAKCSGAGCPGVRGRPISAKKSSSPPGANTHRNVIGSSWGCSKGCFSLPATVNHQH